MTTETTQYLKLKSAEAQKLGRNGGSITYLVLTDTDRQQLYVSIVANDSGGFFSTEIAPFEKIEACLPADRSHPAVRGQGLDSGLCQSQFEPAFLRRSTPSCRRVEYRRRGETTSASDCRRLGGLESGDALLTG